MDPATPNTAGTATPIQSLRGSVVVKLFMIGFLTLVLLIPLTMVGSLVQERQGRQREAAEEISRTWGRPQTVVGPFLSVPYHRTVTEGGVLTRMEEEAILLPSSLEVETRLVPEVRHLGIFEVVVYRSQLRLAGSFASPREDLEGLAAFPLDWAKASLVLGISDLRGVQSGLEVDFAGGKHSWEPGTGGSRLVSSGLHLPLEDLLQASEDGEQAFELDLELSGSRQLEVAPVGKQSFVRMTSSWPDPGFIGGFLPAKRDISEAGFSAQWQVSYLGRGYPEAWQSHLATDRAFCSSVLASVVGVELVDLVTGYSKTHRSIKYAILFVALTFGTFFLFEVFRPTALHPMHYLLVGFALCMFYLLLLSLSEYLPFGAAYGLSSIAIVALVAGYSRSILRDRGRGGLTGVVLATLYGYLYVLLQIRDYALLLGSLGLFAILAVFMFLTRRVDWHDLRLGRRQEVS